MAQASVASTSISAEADYRRYTLLLVCGLIVITGLFGRALNPIFVNDQAEMLVLSQSFEWVYDEQPPLYAWIARLFLLGTNNSVFVLDVIKYGFLSVAVFAIYFTGRAITERFGVGLLSIALAFSLPTMGEDALAEATHSVALIACSAFSALVLLNNLQRPSRWLWLLLAVVWTLGLAFKHTMVVIALSQMMAVWFCGTQFRGALLKHMIGAGLIMALINAPFFYVLANTQAALNNGLHEFHMDAMAWGALRGLLDLISSVLTEAAVLTVIALVLWVTRSKSKIGRDGPLDIKSRFLLISVVVFIGLFAVMVIATGTSVVRDRWLAPALIWLAPLIAVQLTRRLGSRRLRALVTVSLAFVVINAGFRAVESNWLATRGEINANTINYPAMVQNVLEIETAPDFIIAEDASLAANFYLMAQTPTAYPNSYVPPLEFTPRQIMMVWYGDREVPPEMTAILNRLRNGMDVDVCQSHAVDGPLRTHQTIQVRYSVALCQVSGPEHQTPIQRG